MSWFKYPSTRQVYNFVRKFATLYVLHHTRSIRPSGTASTGAEGGCCSLLKIADAHADEEGREKLKSSPIRRQPCHFSLMSHSLLVVVRRNGRRSSLEVQHRNTVSEAGAQPRNTGAELEKLSHPADVVIYATVIPPAAT